MSTCTCIISSSHCARRYKRIHTIHISVCIFECTRLYVYTYICYLDFSPFSYFLSPLILFSVQIFIYKIFIGSKVRKAERDDLGQSERTSRYLPDMYEPLAKSHTSQTCPLVILIINNARPANFCVLYILASQFCTGSLLVQYNVFLPKGERRIDETRAAIPSKVTMPQLTNRVAIQRYPRVSIRDISPRLCTFDERDASNFFKFVRFHKITSECENPNREVNER